MTRTVSSLLAQQPDEELRAMETDLCAQLDRVRFELEMVREALTRRRPRRSGRTRNAAGQVRGITREQVYDLFRSQGKPMQPAEVRDEFQRQGIVTTADAVRQHIRRLRDDRKLSQHDDGYELASTNGSLLETAPGG